MRNKLIDAILKYRMEINRTCPNLKLIDYFSFFLYFPKWYKNLNKNPLDIKLPWINYKGISFLNKHVKQGMNVFEFGSGGSTKFWIGKGCKVFSVEHDKEWYNLVLKSFTEEEITKHKIFLKEPEQLDLIEYDFSDPDHYTSSSLKKFKNYATVIDEFDNNFFSLILIDGRARPSCIKHAIPKLKRGGYLILDNSDREYYSSNIKIKKLLEPLVKAFDTIGPGTYTMMFWQTTIWQRKTNN
tara:strand:+ start:828 stop:1550 length:723 start_codon:yes stop_codon:yes gene_type:complete